MSAIQGNHSNAEKRKLKASKKLDVLFFIAAIVTAAVALFFAPRLVGSIGVSFLADGSGLNKLVTFFVAALVGWLCLLPSQSYKDFVALAKGARIEWKKSVKPDKDTVLKTTMMVLLLVILFALLILLLDWIFGSVLRSIIN